MQGKTADTSKKSSALAAVVSIFVFLVIWQLGCQFTNVGKLLPGPVAVLKEFFKSFVVPIGNNTMPEHIAWSLYRVIPAYLVGAGLGIVIGILMGWYQIAEAIFKPLYEIIRPIPPLAWIPIAILWFGIGEGSKWFLIFLASFVYTTSNAYAGARSVDQVLVGCAKMLGGSDRDVFRYIVLPSSQPYIFSGLQLALASSWASCVAAEMIRSTEGVGWIIISSMDTSNTVQTLVGIVAIGVVGYLLAVIMRGVEYRLCAWNRREV